MTTGHQLCAIWMNRVSLAQSVTLAVTAQDMGWDDRHRLAGERSASDPMDIGCRHATLGHSERRLYLGETNDMIAPELQTAFTHQLAPILCVGDTLEQHAAGWSEDAVQAQLEVLLRVHHRTDGPLLIAYEPAWAQRRRLLHPDRYRRRTGRRRQPRGDLVPGPDRGQHRHLRPEQPSAGR